MYLGVYSCVYTCMQIRSSWKVICHGGSAQHTLHDWRWFAYEAHIQRCDRWPCPTTSGPGTGQWHIKPPGGGKRPGKTISQNMSTHISVKCFYTSQRVSFVVLFAVLKSWRSHAGLLNNWVAEIVENEELLKFVALLIFFVWFQFLRHVFAKWLIVRFGGWDRSRKRQR